MRTIFFTTILLGLALIRCSNRNDVSDQVRQMIDTVGFAHLDWQVDSVITRIQRIQTHKLNDAKVDEDFSWRVAICPHDDYTYVGWQYPAILKNVKAKTVIIFGVAHKARSLNISDQVVFDSYSYWHGPYKNVKVSLIREELMAEMPKELYQVSDSLQKVEHSVESMLPFLQYFNRDVEIISILVPFMDEDRIVTVSKSIATAIVKSMKKHKLQWGNDLALLITTDAVHYGDDEWGGKNYAPYGVDSLGYQKAVVHEHAIIDSCITGELDYEKVRRFIDYTVQKKDYREYKWTWCGRYSVPLGLITALEMHQLLEDENLNGQFIGYSNSIDHKPLPVDDLRMGRTAIATIRHWVGYASVGYR